MSARPLAARLLATVTALASVVAIGYGAGDGAVVWLGLAALGAAVLGLAHALSRRRPRLGSMRRQFRVGIAVAVGQLVVLAAVAAQLMFVSAHDALLLMVVVVFAGIIAVRAAQLLATTAIEDVEALRDTLVAVGRGRASSVPVTGSSDELAELATAANMAIVKLDRSETAQRNLDRRASRTTSARRSRRCGCSPKRSATTSSTRPRGAAISARCAPTSRRCRR